MVSIKVNDSLLQRAWANMDEDVDLAEWMQQQIEAILVRMAVASERKQPTEQLVPETVLSLLGTSRSVNDETLKRLMDFATADPKTITLGDLAGILPAPHISIEDLRAEYISEKYGV